LPYTSNNDSNNGRQNLKDEEICMNKGHSATVFSNNNISYKTDLSVENNIDEVENRCWIIFHKTLKWQNSYVVLFVKRLCSIVSEVYFIIAEIAFVLK